MLRACKSKNKGKNEDTASDASTTRPKFKSKTKAVGRVEEEELDSDGSDDSFLHLVESKGVVHSPYLCQNEAG